jgi:hypothetical protein
MAPSRTNLAHLSTTTLSATVLDETGQPVPDGTAVVVSSTLGYPLVFCPPVAPAASSRYNSHAWPWGTPPRCVARGEGHLEETCPLSLLAPLSFSPGGRWAGRGRFQCLLSLVCHSIASPGAVSYKPWAPSRRGCWPLLARLPAHRQRRLRLPPPGRVRSLSRRLYRGLPMGLPRQLLPRLALQPLRQLLPRWLLRQPPPRLPQPRLPRVRSLPLGPWLQRLRQPRRRHSPRVRSLPLGPLPRRPPLSRA